MPKSPFDPAVPSESLAQNVLADVLKSFEQSGLAAAKKHLRRALASHLTPANRNRLDQQLFHMLVEYYVEG